LEDIPSTIWAPLSGQLLKVDKSVLELQDEKAQSLILLSLFDEVLYELSKEKIAFVLWLKLEKLFLRKSIYNKLVLKPYLFGLRMRKRKSTKRTSL